MILCAERVESPKKAGDLSFAGKKSVTFRIIRSIKSWIRLKEGFAFEFIIVLKGNPTTFVWGRSLNGFLDYVSRTKGLKFILI